MVVAITAGLIIISKKSHSACCEKAKAPKKRKISEDIEIIEVALLHILSSFQNATFGFF